MILGLLSSLSGEILGLLSSLSGEIKMISIQEGRLGKAKS
jgi:hypothetical protein